MLRALTEFPVFLSMQVIPSNIFQRFGLSSFLTLTFMLKVQNASKWKQVNICIFTRNMLLYCKHVTERNAKVFFTVEKDGNKHNYRRRQGKRALKSQQENNLISQILERHKIDRYGLQLPFFTALTISLWPVEDPPSPVWSSEVSSDSKLCWGI